MAKSLPHAVTPSKIVPDAHAALGERVEPLHRHGVLRLATDLLASQTEVDAVALGGLTMRTPGHDRGPAVGLLDEEATARGRRDVLAVDQTEQEDRLRVVLDPAAWARAGRLARTLPASSACGVCGKTRIHLPHSSLAVELARRFGITLVGFLHGERLDVFAAPERIRSLHEADARLAPPAGG